MSNSPSGSGGAAPPSDQPENSTSGTSRRLTLEEAALAYNLKYGAWVFGVGWQEGEMQYVNSLSQRVYGTARNPTFFVEEMARVLDIKIERRR